MHTIKEIADGMAEWSRSAIIAAKGGDRGAKGIIASDTMKVIDNQRNNDYIHLGGYT